MIYPPVHQRVAIPEAMTGGRTAIETRARWASKRQNCRRYGGPWKDVLTADERRPAAEHDLRAGL